MPCVCEAGSGEGRCCVGGLKEEMDRTMKSGLGGDARLQGCRKGRSGEEQS